MSMSQDTFHAIFNGVFYTLYILGFILFWMVLLSPAFGIICDRSSKGDRMAAVVVLLLAWLCSPFVLGGMLIWFLFCLLEKVAYKPSPKDITFQQFKKIVEIARAKSQSKRPNEQTAEFTNAIKTQAMIQSIRDVDPSLKVEAIAEAISEVTPGNFVHSSCDNDER